jgi:DNA-nicking Smr family endonuclease
MTTKKQPPPGDDDPQAFRRAMTGVRPLAAKAVTAQRPSRPGATARFSRARREALASATNSAGDPAVRDSGGQVQFHRAGVRQDVLSKLARGRFPIEAEADLHGMRLHPAQDALREFIGDCIARRLRCVRVIHGKGQRSGPEGPVLKIAVSHWLRQYDAVLAYASARPMDGGSGAVYVLLR